MKLTPTDKLILKQAIDDGGAVVLNGLDMHEGWTRRHMNRAIELANEGYGNLRPVGMREWEFKINSEGRKLVE
jgi:hypothetical protein